MEKILYIVRGVPGSGKSTFAKSICPDYYICEADTFMYEDGVYKFSPTKLKEAHKFCQDRVNNLMVLECPRIVVSNTFTREWEMEAYFEMAKIHDYTVFTLIVENRHGGMNEHGCPEEDVQKMRDRFECKL
jgi:predicted kinase